MKRLAVIGHPIAHSRSPAMQNAALEALGLGGEWSYEAIDLAPEEFEAGVRGLPGEGFVGGNVTIPHKEAAFELADTRSVDATEIRAANTLSFEEEGIRADNTDATGLLAALRDVSGDQAPFQSQRTLILGAGGAARAVAWALAAQESAVEVWNRTPIRADMMLRSAEGSWHVVEVKHLTRVKTQDVQPRRYDLIINATSVGMPGTSLADPFQSLPVRPDDFREGQTVVDLVYAHRETELIAAARSAGAHTVDGLEVLVRQGGESLRIWTGEEPPLDAMRAAARGG